MVLILTKKDKEKIKEFVRKSSVFIYPTDTIYGLGCDATNPRAVQKLREIKNRWDKPFSVIVPSKEWILENCYARNEDISVLPGPYTLIFKLRKKCIAQNVNLGKDTLGVRIPDHWFSQIVKDIGTPVVTTSVNVSGEKYMTSIDNINPKIRESVDFIVYEGEKKGKPSKVIDLTAGEVIRD